MLTLVLIFPIWGFIKSPENEVLLKAINDGINVKTEDFISQYQLSTNLMYSTLISIGIFFMILVFLKLVIFLKNKLAIKKYITKKYLDKWIMTIKEEQLATRLDNISLPKPFRRKNSIMNIEKIFIKKAVILNQTSSAKIKNYQEMHQALSNYLIIIERKLLFYNFEKRKQIVDYYYARAVKMLKIN